MSRLPDGPVWDTHVSRHRDALAELAERRAAWERMLELGRHATITVGSGTARWREAASAKSTAFHAGSRGEAR